MRQNAALCEKGLIEVAERQLTPLSAPSKGCMIKVSLFICIKPLENRNKRAMKALNGLSESVNAIPATQFVKNN